MTNEHHSDLKNFVDIVKSYGLTQICFAFGRDGTTLHPIVGEKAFYLRHMEAVMSVVDAFEDVDENKVISDDEGCYAYIIEPTNNLTGVTLNVYPGRTTTVYIR